MKSLLLVLVVVLAALVLLLLLSVLGEPNLGEEVREFVLSLYDGVAFAEVVILVGGQRFDCILNVTEKLAESRIGYCILDYFSLSFFLRERFAFLYYLSY
jgi:hypothetical protein